MKHVEIFNLDTGDIVATYTKLTPKEALIFYVILEQKKNLSDKKLYSEMEKKIIEGEKSLALGKFCTLKKV